jgi:hypothetical protein
MTTRSVSRHHGYDCSIQDFSADRSIRYASSDPSLVGLGTLGFFIRRARLDNGANAATPPTSGRFSD